MIKMAATLTSLVKGVLDIVVLDQEVALRKSSIEVRVKDTSLQSLVDNLSH